MEIKKIEKLVHHHPYYSYIMNTYSDDVIEDSFAIYEEQTIHTFIESCKNGNFFEILKLLQYIPTTHLNEGLLWVCAKKYKNKNIQICCLESILKTNKIDTITINKCIRICKEYDNEFLINYFH